MHFYFREIRVKELEKEVSELKKNRQSIAQTRDVLVKEKEAFDLER